MTTIHDTADLVSKALRRAWQLGQTYWQQADSEYQSHWKKADATQATFDQLVEDTRAAILTSNSGAQPAPSVPDIDYLVDTLSEFADHHVEHGRMSFDKWTLRSAVEAMLAAAPESKP